MRSDYGRATHPQRLDDPLESQDVSRYPAHDPALLDPSTRRIELARAAWGFVVVAVIAAIAVALLVSL